ncbi:MAG: cytochrome P450 [Sphingomonadales bacterium]|nr:cytochrome P450 [Sphingomonadales bacterium]
MANAATTELFRLHESIAPKAQPRPQTKSQNAIRNIIAIRRNPLDYFGALINDDRDFIPIDLGIDKLYLLNHADHIRHVFQDNAHNYIKSKYYRQIEFLFGDGMFTAEGEQWSWQRRAAQPAFKGPDLKKMAAEMVVAMEDMVRRWEQYAKKGEPVDVSREATRITLDIMFRTLFSRPLGDQANPLFDAILYLLIQTENRIWSPVKTPLWLPSQSNKKFKRCLRIIEEVINMTISERLADNRRHDDLLDCMIDAEKERGNGVPNLKSLRDQVASFVVPGHETTATALTWTFYHLARNALLTRRVTSTIDGVLGRRAPEFGDLKSLAYVEAVMKESLRLYPPVWTFSRTAVEDDHFGRHEIAAGGIVMVCAYALQRSRRYWHAPEAFDPDRFLGPRPKDERFYYFPFGGGHRICIGMRFALMESVIVLSMLMQHFEMELVPGLQISPQAMLNIRPNKSIKMYLRKRS